MNTVLIPNIEIIKPQKTTSYNMPTRVYFGRGAFKILPEILNEYKNILIVAAEHRKNDDGFKQFVSEKIYDAAPDLFLLITSVSFLYMLQHYYINLLEINHIYY